MTGALVYCAQRWLLKPNSEGTTGPERLITTMSHFNDKYRSLAAKCTRGHQGCAANRNYDFLVSDCRFSISPVNYPDPDPDFVALCVLLPKLIAYCFIEVSL